MAYIVRMPKLGMEMQEGEFLEWHVEVGDSVEEDQLIAEIESEKSTAEVTAREAGTLRRRFISPGEVVEPGFPIGIVAGSKDDISDLVEKATADGATVDAAKETEVASTQLSEADDVEPEAGNGEPTPKASAGTEAIPIDDIEPASVEVNGKRLKASPRARMRAGELGVNLSPIDGTGPNGSVVEADVLAVEESSPQPSAAQSQQEPAVKATPRARRRASELGVDLGSITGTGPKDAVTETDVEAVASGTEPTSVPGPESTTGPRDDHERVLREERELDSMRRTIADRLGQSYREAVHVTVHREVDAEGLLDATDDIDAALDVDVSMTDILLLAVSETLTEHPEFNANFEDDLLKLYESQNIGMAVDVENGLVAPVLRNVQDMSVEEIAPARRDLTERTLDGNFTQETLSGGTFTVTNLGVLGVDSFTPIINPPQVAILAVGRLRERPVRDGDDVAWHRHIGFSLAFDHRVVDGGDAARFLDTLAGIVESPWSTLFSRR